MSTNTANPKPYEDDPEEEDNGLIAIKIPRPHPGQLKVLQSKAKWRILLCGRRWGKSFICLILSLEKMLHGAQVAYITPSFSLAKEFYDVILKFIPQRAITYNSKVDLQIKLNTGGTLKFFSGEAISTIRGRTFHRVIIDEAALLPDLENFWEQDIMPTLATTNGDCLFVSTPNGMNYFYALYLKGKHGEQNYESFHYPSSDSPYVSKEFLEQTKKAISIEAYEQEYLALPMASTGNPFGIEAIKRNIITELSKEPTVVYAADVAKHVDYTVIIGLDIDGKMTHFDKFRGEWSLTEEKIKALPSDVLKVIDATGVGDPLFERLQSETGGLIGFKFTSKSKPAIMRELIVDIQKNNIQFNQATAEEAYVFEYKLNSNGYPQYAAQTGYHDDAICALAMANHYRKQAYNNQHWKLYAA